MGGPGETIAPDPERSAIDIGTACTATSVVTLAVVVPAGVAAVIIALLLRISDETVERAEAPGALTTARTAVGGDAAAAPPPARR